MTCGKLSLLHVWKNMEEKNRELVSECLIVLREDPPDNLLREEE